MFCFFRKNLIDKPKYKPVPFGNTTAKNSQEQVSFSGKGRKLGG